MDMTARGYRVSFGGEGTEPAACGSALAQVGFPQQGCGQALLSRGHGGHWGGQAASRPWLYRL